MKRFLWGVAAVFAVSAVWLLFAQQASPDYPMNFRTDATVPATTAPSVVAANPSAIQPEVIFVSDLPDYGPAPELTNESWLNVETPLRLSALRGKVVLIDMWTFG